MPSNIVMLKQPINRCLIVFNLHMIWGVCVYLWLKYKYNDAHVLIDAIKITSFRIKKNWVCIVEELLHERIKRGVWRGCNTHNTCIHVYYISHLDFSERDQFSLDTSANALQHSRQAGSITLTAIDVIIPLMKIWIKCHRHNAAIERDIIGLTKRCSREKPFKDTFWVASRWIKEIIGMRWDDACNALCLLSVYNHI